MRERGAPEAALDHFPGSIYVYTDRGPLAELHLAMQASQNASPAMHDTPAYWQETSSIVRDQHLLSPGSPRALRHGRTGAMQAPDEASPCFIVPPHDSYGLQDISATYLGF